MTQRIFHIDMDAFFASVELLRYPQLKGYPIVIGGQSFNQEDWPNTAEDCAALPVESFATLRHYFGRGVVSTCTYEARTKGVHSAMSIMRATVLCPDAILLPVDFTRYREYSRRFKEAVATIAPTIENRGIDEIFVDATHHTESMQVLAERIKTAVFEATGLTCSIGGADNKLLAKMASEVNKPNGIYLWDLQDRTKKLWAMPCKTIPGIGPKTQGRLHDANIQTVGQLAAMTNDARNSIFGKKASVWIAKASQGLDDSPIITESEPVSFSKEITMPRDMDPIHDKNELTPLFTKLCASIASELEKKNYTARGVGIKLKYKDFTQVTRELMLDEPTQDLRMIRKAAGQALKRAPLNKKIRLMGVKVYHLEKVNATSTLQEV